MSNESFLPPVSRRGWVWVLSAFLLIAIIGVTMSLIFRDHSTPEERTALYRRRNADRVCYTIVFSKVEAPYRKQIIDEIIADIGADSSSTDLVIGSSATDPGSKSLADYRAALHVAMTETGDVIIGKQSQITSMVAGLLTKNELPATIYFVGDLSSPLTDGVTARTINSAEAFAMRSEIMAPVSVVSYMQGAGLEYSKLFEGRSFKMESRTMSRAPRDEN